MMANSQVFLLEITAYWSKRTCFFLLLFALSPLAGLVAQNKLSPKERHVFNQKFFEAKAFDAKGDLDQAFKVYKELYEIEPKNALVNYELAQFYTENSKADEAVFHAEKASDLEPNNIWYIYLKARIYGQFGYTKKKVEVYESLVAKEPRSNEYRFELARAHLANNSPKDAIKQLNLLEKQMGKNEALSDQKKAIYLELGDVEGAVKEVQELIEAYPQTIEYYGSLGQLYSVNGFPEKAFAVYQKMLAIDSLDPRPHLDLANYYRANNNFPKSIYHLKVALRSRQMELEQKIPVLLSLFNASASDTTLRSQVYQIMEHLLITDAEDPRIYAMYGDYLSRDGRDTAALKSYKKALRLKGGQKFQIWEQVLLIEVQNEMYDSLAVHAPLAIEAFPNQPLPYFFGGVAQSMLGNYQEAVYSLEDGLNYVFGNQRLKEQFYVQLADAYHRLENHSKSDGYFEKALQVNSNNPTALNNYAYYLAVRKENLDRALELTVKSNNLSPESPVFLDTYAWVLYQRGEYALALEKIEKVFILQPKQEAEVLEHYGDILKANGKNQAALEQYKKAAALAEVSPEVAKKIKALQWKK